MDYNGAHADAFDLPPASPEEVGIHRCRALQLVDKCRSSGIQASRTSEHFNDEDDFFVLDKDGDSTKQEYECPGSLSEMLIIVHEYQRKRQNALEAIRSTGATAFTQSNRVDRSKSSNYDFFCSTPDKHACSTLDFSSPNGVFTALTTSSDHENSCPSPDTTSCSITHTLETNEDILREIFGSSDEEE